MYQSYIRISLISGSLIMREHCMYIYTCIFKYIYACIYYYIYTCICIQIHTYMYTCTHTYMHVYKYIHTLQFQKFAVSKFTIWKVTNVQSQKLQFQTFQLWKFVFWNFLIFFFNLWFQTFKICHVNRVHPGLEKSLNFDLDLEKSLIFIFPWKLLEFCHQNLKSPWIYEFYSYKNKSVKCVINSGVFWKKGSENPSLPGSNFP